jgi:FkbM family methyltransferase
MLVYTLLFTLVNRDPCKNKYIEMFFIWLTFLARNGGLTKGDTVMVLIDDKTLDRINDYYMPLGSIFDDLPFELTFHSIEQPVSLSDGFCERFRELNGIFSEFSLFLDLDILVFQSIKPLEEQYKEKKNSLIVMPEGDIYTDNYGGKLIDISGVTLPGVTAGLFGFTPGATIVAIFNKIIERTQKNKKTPFYTVDQPFFNYYYYLTASTPEAADYISFFDKYSLGNNFYTIHNKIMFLNLCGDPGDSKLHFEKMFLKLLVEFFLSNSKDVKRAMKFVDEIGYTIDTDSIEAVEQQQAKKYIKKEAKVLELGARYGTVSCIISKLLENEKNLVAVEPDSRVWESLEYNMKENKCKFNLVKGFISKKKLLLEFLPCKYSTYSVETNDISGSTPSYTLQEIQEKYNLVFDTLVADCEGFLGQFLEENPELFTQLNMILFEKDRPEFCDYEKIQEKLLEFHFTRLVEGFHEVWIKQPPAVLQEQKEQQGQQNPPPSA